MTNSADSPAIQTTSTNGERKPSYHHGNLREALIEGGLALLEEYGAADLSQRLLARQLGVSQTAPYHHFGDKNGLLAALATEGFRRSGNVLQTVSIEHQSLERRVRGICAGYVRFAREKPELFRLMYGTAVQRKNEYPELVAASTEAFEALATRVSEMIKDFDIKHVNSRQATTSLLGLSHGLAHLIVDRRVSPILAGYIDDERIVVEQAARLFVCGFHPLPND